MIVEMWLLGALLPVVALFLCGKKKDKRPEKSRVRLESAMRPAQPRTGKPDGTSPKKAEGAANAAPAAAAPLDKGANAPDKAQPAAASAVPPKEPAKETPHPHEKTADEAKKESSKKGAGSDPKKEEATADAPKSKEGPPKPKSDPAAGGAPGGDVALAPVPAEKPKSEHSDKSKSKSAKKPKNVDLSDKKTGQPGEGPGPEMVADPILSPISDEYPTPDTLPSENTQIGVSETKEEKLEDLDAEEKTMK